MKLLTYFFGGYAIGVVGALVASCIVDWAIWISLVIGGHFNGK